MLKLKNNTEIHPLRKKMHVHALDDVSKRLANYTFANI